jgi:hypothetical protein
MTLLLMILPTDAIDATIEVSQALA